MAHRMTHQQLDARLETVELELAELRETLSSIAGQLLADAPAKPKARKAPARKA